MRHVVMDFTVRPDDLIADCRLRSVIFISNLRVKWNCMNWMGYFGLFWVECKNMSFFEFLTLNEKSSFQIF